MPDRLYKVLYIILSLISIIPMKMALAGQLPDSGQIAAADSPPGGKEHEA